MNQNMQYKNKKRCVMSMRQLLIRDIEVNKVMSQHGIPQQANQLNDKSIRRALKTIRKKS